jgi:hypothetical protein
MLIQIQRLDVTPFVRESRQPVMLLKRELLGNDGVRRIQPSAAKLTNRDPCLILQHALPGGDKPKWSKDSSNTHVRIPLFDYLLTDPAIETLVHFGAQTGALAVALIPPGCQVERLLVLVGNVFTRPDGQPGYQAWVGYAICLKE